jgi:uncharacterized protein (TIGR00251 family)
MESMNVAAVLRAVPSGVEISVKVVPGASRDRIAGVLGDALKVQVAAPPERGKANAAVEALLAGKLGVPAKRVSVCAGHASPRKTVLVSGMSVEEATRRLAGEIA